MDLQLDGWRTLVTGASSGIGRSIATTLRDEGARVVGVARDADRLPTGLAGVVQADLLSSGEEDRIVADAVAQLGGLDAVVSGAGQGIHGSVGSTDDETWSDGLQLNLLSVVRLLRAAMPSLRSSSGRILVLTALSGTEPRAGHAVSNTAKAGLAALAKTVSREEAGAGVLINCLAPGRIRSRQVERNFPDAEAEQAFCQQHIPIGRFGEPEEASALAALLVSPVNTYITGQTIHVDGGMSHGT